MGTILSVLGVPFTKSIVPDKTISGPLSTFEFSLLTPNITTGVNVGVPLTDYIFDPFPASAGTGVLTNVPFTGFLFAGLAPTISSGGGAVSPDSIFEITTYLPTIQTGVNTQVPSSSFEFTSYVPEVELRIITKVSPPSTDYEFYFFTPTILTGVNVGVPVSSFEFNTGTIGYYKSSVIESCSGETIPLSHMEDSRKLEADAYIDLFEIVLSGNIGRLYLKMNSSVTWQGNTYEGTGIKIEGVGSYADDEVSRPKLTIWNPEGIFSALVDRGDIDNAKIYRIRILKEHLDEDIPIYRRQQWRVTRVLSLKKPYIHLELRDMLDGQNFLTPGRMFIPPDFPSVSLQ